jgi:hypothetical protein
MAPVGTGTGNVSAARARLSGPSGIKGIIASGKTTGIAFFASLGGFVYGYNQGMFAQVLTMNSFIKAVTITPDPYSYCSRNLSNMSCRPKVMLQRLVSIKVF